MGQIPTLVFHILAATFALIQCDSTESHSKVVKPEERIVDGEFASLNEYPHHLLLLKLTPNEILLCGASLLTRKWALTAAHCVGEPGPDGVNAFTIIAGKHHLKDEPDTQKSKAEQIFIHPCRWDRTIDEVSNNDIALIKLKSPFTFNNKVMAIQIDDIDRAKPGTEATAIGWGRVDPRTNIAADTLKKIKVDIPTDKECENNVNSIDVRSRQCVFDTGGTICRGDSGGSLICKDGVNYVCGISSTVSSTKCFGLGTQAGNFSTFVRVFHYRHWIEEVIRTGNKSNADCVIPKVTFNPLPLELQYLLSTASMSGSTGEQVQLNTTSSTEVSSVTPTWILYSCDFNHIISVLIAILLIIR